MPRKSNKPAPQFSPNKDSQELKLPAGVKLRLTLRGHTGFIGRVAWSPDGQMFATPSEDMTIRLWDAQTGTTIRIFEGHSSSVTCVAWSPTGQWLASGSREGGIKLWNPQTGTLSHVVARLNTAIKNLAWSPDGITLAASSAGSIFLWDDVFKDVRRILRGHTSYVNFVEWIPGTRSLVSGSGGGTVRVWDGTNGEEISELGLLSVSSIAFGSYRNKQWLACAGFSRVIKIWDTSELAQVPITLEGHTDEITSVAFSSDGSILASKSLDNKVILWSCATWRQIGTLLETSSTYALSSLAFHPRLPWLATVGSEVGATEREMDTLVHIWELDIEALLSKMSKAGSQPESVRHTTAKIVLVGDSGVGKTGLGWRLAHGDFKEHASTHGQQFWVLNQLRRQRADGTECEAILWDLAGQPDYRLTHALFLDDADLALVLFDPTDSRDPLHGVEFWLKQLKVGRTTLSESPGKSPAILIGARADRGEARLTLEELAAFCGQRLITGGYVATSAKEDMGLDDLLRRMEELVPWEEKSSTVTTINFKRVKDYVLGLKENRRRRRVIVAPQDLRKRLEKTDKKWKFTEAEMMTAVGHLANYGYLRVLRTSTGEERILLAPELLNNLAASLVLEARRNPRGLGSLEEAQLLEGEYQFRELDDLLPAERDVLLDSAALLFIKHSICFRETDPLNEKSFLVFPELINLKRPLLQNDQPTEDGVAYTVIGAVENVYASLVVLLGYTQTFTRTDQWSKQARYEVGDGLLCGFRQDGERDGELDLVLYFGMNVGQPVRTLFQGLFESFLSRRNLSVYRYEPVVCSNSHHLNRAVVRDESRAGADFVFCPKCGEKLLLPKAHEPIQLTHQQQAEVDTQRRVADLRTRFEQAIFRVQAYVKDQGIAVPECFVSYAWGEKEQELWVERSLATDLQKAGINVLLDKWANQRIGANVMRFMERIEECNKLIVVGTPGYREKYANKRSEKGHVLAAEGQMIGLRKLGAQSQHESVLPVLLAGDEQSSFPLWLQGHVYADFRDKRQYFMTAFDLILSLYEIAPHEKAVSDLRESLRDSEMR